jgi:hypothetical protein
MSEADIDNLSRDLEHTRRVAVERPIPIAVRYDRVEVRGDQVRVFPDIYRKSPALTAGVVLAAMARSGIEESRVDQDRGRTRVDAARYSPDGALQKLARVGCSLTPINWNHRQRSCRTGSTFVLREQLHRNRGPRHERETIGCSEPLFVFRGR